MGKQRTIYASDEEWDRVGRLAKDFDTSISKLLMGKLGSCQLDRIESKLDGANEQLSYISGLVLGLASNRKEANPEKYESHRGAEIPVDKIKDDFINALADEDVDLEAEELKQANERLLKKRTEIKGAIKTASELPDRYKSPEGIKPRPKAKWKGAK